MIRLATALLLPALVLLSVPPQALAAPRPRSPGGQAAFACPPGEKSFSFDFGGKSVTACQPASAGAFCAGGRYFLRSPATGQSTCTPLGEASWFCPAGEKPKNYTMGGRLEAGCEPVRAQSLCARGRVYLRSPATGQSTCMAVKDGSWFCPAGERPANFIEGGHRSTGCVPASGTACAKGRRAVFNTVIRQNVCMK